MKKMFLVAMVFLMSQFSFAATVGPKVEAQIARYAERVKESREKESNKFDFKNDVNLAKAVKTSLERILGKATSADSQHLMNLMNFDSSGGAEVLTKIIEQSKIIADSKDVQAVATANATLELLSILGSKLDVILPIDAKAREAIIAEQTKQVTLGLKISESIAKFQALSSKVANEYAAEYKKTLMGGKSPELAMLAAKNKTGKDIKEDQLPCD